MCSGQDFDAESRQHFGRESASSRTVALWIRKSPPSEIYDAAASQRSVLALGLPTFGVLAARCEPAVCFARRQRSFRMPKRASKTKLPHRSYHHGDLERALVRAGLAIVEKHGIDALTLRNVARRAKVSHTAPYHHFTNKAELLAAVSAAGFDGLVEAISNEIAAARAGKPSDRLRCIGRAYVRYAVRRPTVFRLMFRPELTRPRNFPRLHEAESRAFGSLLETIMAMQQSGEMPGADPRPPATFAWSAVHGLSMLHIDDVFGETPLSQVAFDRLEADLHEAIVAGLRAHLWQ